MHRKRSGIAIAVVALLSVAVYLSMRTKPAPPRPRPLAFSTAVSRTGPSSLYPDPSRTPGATNADVTQENINQTICNPDWSTKSIRPPASYTTKLKKEQMEAWGLSGTTADYEEDHFISLELGGNPTDPLNLWPEPYHPTPGARQKDTVENYLHKQVCTGALALQAAQDAITRDWYQVYIQIHQ